MPEPARKPPAKMPEYPAQESRVPRSIHFTPTEWEAISHAARMRGHAPCAFARMLAMYALSIASAPAFAEGALGVLGMGAAVPGGSRGTGRF